MSGGIINWWIDRPCPKCGYVRTELDRNPDWQCPSCGIAYVKYHPEAAAPRLAGRLAAGGREMAAEAKSDSSVLVLIATNIAALVVGYALGMSLTDMMLVYWLQSCVIGISVVIRILCLKRFDPSGFTVSGRPVEETRAGRRTIAAFFALHYGGFHLGFLILIATLGRAEPGVDFEWHHLVLALVFAANHAYSLLHNVRRDARGRPKAGTLFAMPYVRILPMHLTMLASGFIGTGGALAFFFFGALKTGADAAMHTAEHHVLARPARG